MLNGGSVSLKFSSLVSFQPYQKSVADYKPNMDALNKLGNTYDAVVREVEQPAHKQPHGHSTQLDQTKRSGPPAGQRSLTTPTSSTPRSGRDRDYGRPGLSDLDQSGMLDEGEWISLTSWFMFPTFL